MDFKNIYLKKYLFQEVLKKLSAFEKKDFNDNFTVEYTHDSTAIEGNTLTLTQTHMILTEGITPAEISLKELDEVRFHADAWDFVKKAPKDNLNMKREFIQDIHQHVVKVDGVGGLFRTCPVYIRGSQHVPPAPEKLYDLMDNMVWEANKNEFDNPIHKAAWLHAKLTYIHPFLDGNGRTARLLLNYELLSNGFPPTNIKSDNRQAYFDALEEFNIHDNIRPFYELVYDYVDKTLDKFLNMYKQHISIQDLDFKAPAVGNIARQYVPKKEHQK